MSTVTHYQALLLDKFAALIIPNVPPQGKIIFAASARDMVRMILDEPAHRFLQSLPKDADGHIDADDRLWIGGNVVAILLEVKL